MPATEVQEGLAGKPDGADSRERPLQLRVLGPLEALADGVPLTLGGRKERTALALLVVAAGKVVATDDLIDGVWGEEPTLRRAPRFTPTSRPRATWTAMIGQASVHFDSRNVSATTLPRNRADEILSPR